MDNFHLDVTSRGADTLKKAMQLFHPHVQRVTGYSTEGGKLVLYWNKSLRATALPFPMMLDQAADFSSGWLAHADYGPEPGHDGSNSKGWRLHCDTWGIVDGDHYAFAAIQPVWAMHGK
jgi:hypothetical protein